MGGRLWKIGDRVVDLSQQGMIMGVLNVTPDSFSDGGEFFSREEAVQHGLQMVAEGAQIIDVGGESTRPGAQPVSLDEELRRVIPVIEELRAKLDTFLSIDSSKAEVAKAALEAGASIVNDVTGGRGDKEMMSMVAERKAGFIVMHMQGDPRTMQIDPRYDDVVTEVRDFFRQQYERALKCGIDPMAMAFDPGIGFGKTFAHNLELLKNPEGFRIDDRPIVVGVSRKSFLGELSGSPKPGDRLPPTVALTALLRGKGADVFRVHDIKENFAALQVAQAIQGT